MRRGLPWPSLGGSATGLQTGTLPWPSLTSWPRSWPTPAARSISPFPGPDPTAEITIRMSSLRDWPRCAAELTIQYGAATYAWWPGCFTTWSDEQWLQRGQCKLSKSKTSLGFFIRSCAPSFRSSSWSRNPQSAPTEHIWAARAVCISIPESPT